MESLALLYGSVSISIAVIFLIYISKLCVVEI